MIALHYQPAQLPWTVSEEEEQRFRRILRRILILFFALSLVWPLLPTRKIDRPAIEEVPPRLAKLVLEQRQLPKPELPVRSPEVESITRPRTETIKPETIKPETKEVKIEAARKKASRVGVLAFSQELADLRSSAATANVEKSAKLGPGIGTGKGAGIGSATGPGVGQSSGKALGEGARAIITANAAKGSGGINTSALSRGTGGGGLGGRSTTQVNSPLGGGEGAGGDGVGGRLQRGGSGKAGRSIEEIKLVFDRNKGAIYTIYNRALRQDPSLQGKVVLKLTIAPSGQVQDCLIVSSELRAPDLERKLLARIKQFNFGAKNVETMIVTYPIDFLPS